MKRKIHILLPHIIFYFLLVTLFLIAFAINSGVLGAFYGRVMAALTDPLLWIGGGVLGAIILQQRYLIPALLGFAIVASYWISEMNAEWLNVRNFSVELVCVRFVAVLFIGFLFNAGRLLMDINKSRTS